MKRSFIINLIVFFLFNAVFVYSAQSGSSKSSPILLIDSTCAEGIGVGNNNVMQEGKYNFIFQNPGILGTLESMEAGISYIPWIFETSFLTGIITFPTPTAVFGMGIVSYNVEEFDHYSLNGALSSEKLDMSELMLMMGAGREIYNDEGVTLSLGFSIKYFFSKIHHYSSSGIAFDVGGSGIYELSNNTGDIIYGLAFQNIGMGPKYDNQRSSLPLKASFGIGYRYTGFNHNGMLTPMFEIVKETVFLFGFGVEYGYNNMLFARIGYSFGTAKSVFSGLSAGIGVKYMAICFDYALKPASVGEKSIIHSFSLGYSF